MGEDSQKVQISIHKISSGDAVYNMVIIAKNTVLCIISKLLRVDLKSSCHKEKNYVW